MEEFKTCGASTFLTKNQPGDRETLYNHVVWGYLPQMACETWQKHNLGIGIFTMQGFERRNKESKNCFRRFTNKRGNTNLQNLKRLWDVFPW